MRRVPFQLRLQRLQRCVAVRDVVRHALRHCRDVGATLDQRQRQDVQRRILRRFATSAGFPLGLVRRLVAGCASERLPYIQERQPVRWHRHHLQHAPIRVLVHRGPALPGRTAPVPASHPSPFVRIPLQTGSNN